MSVLENLTKPILAPMVDGSTIELSRDARTILSTWALKTLMVFDSQADRYWRQDEREAFRNRPADVLSQCMIVAADYSGSAKANAQPSRRLIRRLSGEITDIPSFRGVLTVGRALMMVDTNRYKEQTGRDSLMLPPRHFDRTVHLGDVRVMPVTWPPAPPIDDEAFLEFTDAVPR